MGTVGMPKIFKKMIIQKLSKNFCDTKVVGVINSRQVKLNGSLSQFTKMSETYEITLKSAILAEIEGNYNRAVILYTFSGAFNNITRLLIKLLGSVLSKLPADAKKREYTALVQKFLNSYTFHSTSHPRKKEQQLVEFQNFIDLQCLFKISQIWNTFYKEIRDYKKVITMINQLDVLPCLEILLEEHDNLYFVTETPTQNNLIAKHPSYYKKIVKKGLISLYHLVLSVLDDKIKNLILKLKNGKKQYLNYKLKGIQMYIKRLEVHLENVNKS